MTCGRSFSAPHNLILFLFGIVKLTRNQLFRVNHPVSLERIVLRIDESLRRIFRIFLVFQVSVSPKLRYIDHIEWQCIIWIIAKSWWIISVMHYSSQKKWKNDTTMVHITNSFVGNKKMEKIYGFCSILQSFKNPEIHA